MTKAEGKAAGNAQHKAAHGATRYYVSTFCNFAHRRPDGMPINHECYVLPFIEAEASGDMDRALEIQRAKGHGRHSMGIRRTEEELNNGN